MISTILFCSQIFVAQPQPVVTEFRIEYNDSNAFKILKKINRIFYEYPREYMENTRTTASVTVPESRWLEIFGEDYETVIAELLKAEIYKIETFEDGSQTRVFDASLIIAYSNDGIKTFTNEWVNTQRSFFFQFDRRILRLMELNEEPAYVGNALEGGVIERKTAI
jgi:hypothetical protein